LVAQSKEAQAASAAEASKLQQRLDETEGRMTQMNRELGDVREKLQRAEREARDSGTRAEAAERSREKAEAELQAKVSVA